mmetsp:Transcript_21482/g.43757  ORF Transcript_21482/g.43757 Transcript_21482/m.43757 type:complete len:323 (-) Transcript_21482:37-1005(-)
MSPFTIVAICCHQMVVVVVIVVVIVIVIVIVVFVDVNGLRTNLGNVPPDEFLRSVAKDFRGAIVGHPNNAVLEEAEHGIEGGLDDVPHVVGEVSVFPLEDLALALRDDGGTESLLLRLRLRLRLVALLVDVVFFALLSNGVIATPPRSRLLVLMIVQRRHVRTRKHLLPLLIIPGMLLAPPPLLRQSRQSHAKRQDRPIGLFYFRIVISRSERRRRRRGRRGSGGQIRHQIVPGRRKGKEGSEGEVLDVREEEEAGGAVAVENGAFAGEEEGGVGGGLEVGDEVVEGGAVAGKGARRGGGGDDFGEVVEGARHGDRERGVWW